MPKGERQMPTLNIPQNSGIQHLAFSIDTQGVFFSSLLEKTSIFKNGRSRETRCRVPSSHSLMCLSSRAPNDLPSANRQR